MIPVFSSLSADSRGHVQNFVAAHSEVHTRLQQALAGLRELPSASVAGSLVSALESRDRLRQEAWQAYADLLDGCSVGGRLLVVISAELKGAATQAEAELQKAQQAAERGLRKTGITPENVIPVAAQNPDAGRVAFEKMRDRAENVQAAQSSMRQAFEDVAGVARVMRQMQDQATEWAAERQKLARLWLG